MRGRKSEKKMRQPQQSVSRFSSSKMLSLAGVLAAGPYSWAQRAVPPPATASPEFEVASVKSMPPSSAMYPAPAGGPGTTDPGQITWPGVSLKWLLKAAYDVRLYQISGPTWLDSQLYAIVAKVPEGATKAQVNLMWQKLLKDRFGVLVHHELRMFQGEEMTLAKGASKLKETDLRDSSPQTMPGSASKKTSPDDLLHRLFPNAAALVVAGGRGEPPHTWEGTIAGGCGGLDVANGWPSGDR